MSEAGGNEQRLAEIEAELRLIVAQLTPQERLLLERLRRETHAQLEALVRRFGR